MNPAKFLAAALLAVSAIASLRAEPYLVRTEDIAEHPECAYCGMDRSQWSHTRHLLEYEDGTIEGTCSIRCAGTSLITHWDKSVVRVSAADAGSPQDPEPLLTVARLRYLVDPAEGGTMTGVRKWAYASRVAAGRARSPQGQIVDFSEAVAEALAEVGRDIARPLLETRRGRRRR